MPEAPRPFRISASDDDLQDLRRRLSSTRFADAETVDDWSQGLPLAYLRQLVQYWAHEYDFSARAARLNRFAQFKQRVGELDIHYIHARSPHDGALPLIMTHGWPGSIAEFHKVIEPLTDPPAHGGDAADAFHVVAPSLPGYGFSDHPRQPGFGLERIADTWAALMAGLGYGRYVAQGGDWGSLVSTCIGARDTQHCLGIHLTLPIVLPTADSMDDLTDYEQQALQAAKEYGAVDSGYAKVHSTRPQTIAAALSDSPAGLAAWMIEKFWKWTDCDGHPENVLSRDELLDNVMLYWLPNTAASAARLYWESYASPPFEPVEVKVGCSIFPKDFFRASERWCRARFPNLVHYRALERGGHFASLECPDVFVQELRSCFRHMR